MTLGQYDPIFYLRILNLSNFQWVEITFQRENKSNPSIDACDDDRSSCVNHYGYLGYLSIVWWLLSSYPFIDASTEGHKGKDENIYGEEGGILWSIHQPRQANTLQDITMSKLY